MVDNKVKDAPGSNPVADFEALGQTVIRLSKGELVLAEPGIGQLKRARLDSAQWASHPDRVELVTLDPVLSNWDFVCRLIVECADTWTPVDPKAPNVLTMEVLDSFPSRELAKLSRAVEQYAGNES